jgi:hypothetical protein
MSGSCHKLSLFCMESLQPVTSELSPLMDKLRREKKAAREMQERKWPDWNENYELSRNKVKTNRLTQRQAVNIPLMKETEKTILSRIDDPPKVDWSEKGGDEEKEIVFQTIWDQQFKRDKFEWKDTVDKKNVIRYGISTKMLNLSDTGVDVEVQDVFDILWDPLMNPVDTESARFIVRQNIYRSLRDILADDRYTAEGKAELEKYKNSAAGIIQSAKNAEAAKEKNDRLVSMGVERADFDLFAGGDVVINLTEHYTKIWENGKFVKYVVTYADETVELMKEPLSELIGVDFWPFTMWSEDPETNDIYPDSIGDLVRVPNKVLNIFYSQLIENRTLRNFNMHWYDATKQGYVPQTYEPGPGRMLPAPGNPKETIMPVETDGLDETLQSMEYITSVVERATGATAIEKGVGEKTAQTLGEVKILQGQANERATAMTKFYRISWYETAWKWAELMMANPPKEINLYKTGRSGKMYGKKVYPSDWMSKWGYEPTVSSTSEQEGEQMKGMQKLQFVQSLSPQNPALRKIVMKRANELVDFTPEELREVEEAEEMMAQQAQMAAAGPADQPQPQAQPQPPEPQGVDPAQLQELQALMNG